MCLTTKFANKKLVLFQSLRNFFFCFSTFTLAVNPVVGTGNELIFYVGLTWPFHYPPSQLK